MSPVRARLIRSVTVLALAVPLFAVATPTQAQRLDRMDPAGDVFTLADIEEGDDSYSVPAPDQLHSDIVSTRFRHTNKAVRVRVNFADLHRRKDPVTGRRPGDFRVWATVKTNEGIGRVVEIAFNGPANPWTRPQMWSLKSVGKMIPCRINHYIDFVKDVVVLGIPRTCLSRPRWVRIGATSGVGVQDEAANFAFDDALRVGFDVNHPLREGFTPRLYR